MTKRIYISLLFLSLFLVSGFAASEAEYRKLSKSYTLQADGSQEYRYQMELTLFTHTAMNSTYGESFIVYNPKYQELVIHSSYTKQKDGTMIQTPENAFVEVLPRQAANAPDFNHLKEMVVVHTGLELGATIFLDYSVITKAGYLPELDIYEEIQQTSLVKDYTITISVPESKPLLYTLGGVNSKEKVSAANGKKEVQWSLRNVPAASRAPGVRAANGDVPYLTAISYASETDALQTLSSQFNVKGDIQSLTFAEALTEDCKTDREKLFAIREYVVDGLDLSRLSLPETGFRLRSLPQVTATAYGTAAEKLHMMVTLLNELNIPATPVAQYKVPAASQGKGLSAMEELFVVAEADGETYYLSLSSAQPAKAVFSASYLPVMNLYSPEKSLTIQPPQTTISYQAKLNLSPEKAEVQATSNVGKSLVTYQKTPDTQDKEITSIALKDNQGYITLTLPDVPQSLSHSFYKQYNSERKENLRLDYKPDESYAYTISLPSGMQLVTPVKEETIQNKAGKIVWSVKQSGQEVTVNRSLQLNTDFITPALYNDFRSLMIWWGDPNTRNLLFKRN